MSLRLPLCFGMLLVLVSSLAHAQQPFVESIEVRVANVDVVVTDGQGRRVHGLGRDDFELAVDGQLRDIANFYEVLPDAQVAQGSVQPSAAVAEEARPDRRRLIVFFVDLYSLEPFRRNETITALQNLCDRSMRPGDQAMVATWRRRMVVPLTFTADRTRVKRALDDLRKMTGNGLAYDKQIVRLHVRSALQEAQVSGSSPRGGSSVRAAYAAAITYVNAFAEQQRKISSNLTESLEELFRSVSGAEGKKVVILVSENFPQYPGAGLYQYVNELFAPYTGQIGRMVIPQIEAGRNSLLPLSERIARAANANEIALNAIYTGEASGEAPAEKLDATTTAETFLDFSDSGGTLSGLAAQTGGIALVGSRNFEAAARAIGDDLSGYYSLGYRVTASEKAAAKIVVRTKRAGYTVRSRRAFVPKTRAEEIGDGVVSRLYQERVPSAQEISVKVGEAESRRRSRRSVPIEITFPTSLLTLFPQEGKEVGGFSVVVAASDGENRLSDVQRRDQGVSWEKGAVPPRVVYSLDVVVRKGEGALSIGIVDQISQQVTYTTVEMR